MNRHAPAAQVRTRRHLVGSAVAAAGLWAPVRAVAQDIPPAEPEATAEPSAGANQGMGSRLLTRFVDEVLNGRSVENFEAIFHTEVESPSGSTMGIEAFRQFWSNDAIQRTEFDVHDEFAIQVVMGNEQWGIAYVGYTVQDSGGYVGRWKVVYVAQIADERIKGFDVFINETDGG